MNEFITLFRELHITGDSFIVSLSIAIGVWIIKGTAKLLIKTLLDTIVEVRSFREVIAEMKPMIVLFPKMQTDLNEYYKRLKKVEDNQV